MEELGAGRVQAQAYMSHPEQFVVQNERMDSEDTVVKEGITVKVWQSPPFFCVVLMAVSSTHTRFLGLRRTSC